MSCWPSNASKIPLAIGPPCLIVYRQPSAKPSQAATSWGAWPGRPWRLGAKPGERRARYVPDGSVTGGASQVLTDNRAEPATCGFADGSHLCTHSQADTHFYCASLSSLDCSAFFDLDDAA